jgi:hypothetical protein
MKRSLRKIASSKLFIAASALVLLYALAGFLLVPHLIERYVPRYAQEQLGYEASIGKVRFNPFLLKLEAHDFRLGKQGQARLGEFWRLVADFELSSLFRRAWTFGAVELDGPDLRVEIQPNGRLNLAEFARSVPWTPPTDRPPRRVLVQRLAVTNGRVTLRDLSDATPASTTFAPINLEVNDLATVRDLHGRYTVTAALPQGGAMAWRGDIALVPLSSAGDLEIKGLRLASAWDFVQDMLRLAQAEGELDFAGRYRFAYAEGKLTLGVEAIRAQIARLRLKQRADGEPILTLDTITAAEARVDLAQREVVVPKLEVRGGKVVATVDSAGKLNWQNIVPTRAPKREVGVVLEARPWKYSVEMLKAEGVRVALANERSEPRLPYDLDVASATVRGIASASKSPIGFDAALRMASGGTVNAKGTIAQDFGRAAAQVEVAEVSLAPLQPLLARYATVDLKSGSLFASTKIEYGAAGPSLRAAGAISIADLLVNEAKTGDRLLSWKRMSADDVTFTLAPNELAIKEIRLLEVGAKIEIAKDRGLNLAQVLRMTSTPSQAALPSARAKREDILAANIGRVHVRNGTVDFADYSLVLPFSARIRRFNGAAVGLNTARANRAEVRFEGRIEDSGTTKVEGGLNAFNPRRFTDLRVHFDDVQMEPLSPYAATFAGRKIASGRLWLDLHYKIVNGELVGENKIAMDNFTLGERVEAPNALDLPLDLAIAVLTDSKGRINVAVPVTGDLNNPKFSYGTVIREALASFLTRVVTAPFRALGRLVGSGEGTESIDFEPGRARLTAADRTKLDKVAEALKERPRLKLVVRGPYDPRQDGEALRTERVRREVAEALGVKLERREDPGPVAYSDAATQRALEKLLTARAGPQAIQDFKQTFEKKSGREAERVNPLLSVVGRASRDREFYEAMFQRLVELYPLSEADAQALAKRRADVIVRHLVESAGVDPNRAVSGEMRVLEDRPNRSESGVTAELALEALKEAS